MKMSQWRMSRKPRRGGFTLIELVMVIFILAIVAGLIVPIVGWMRRSANYSAQANTAASITSNMELFRTTYGNNGYPDNMDSLVLNDQSDIVPTTDNAGYLDHGFEFLTLGDLDPDQTACFNWLDTVWDHDANANAGLQGSPGNSAIHQRAYDGTNMAIAWNGALSPDDNGEQALMLSEIYPDGVPADVTLVALGIGPNNNAIGRTLTSPPMDPRVDPSEVYGRYVAIYAVYSPRAGRRAQLKCVLNAFGRTQNNALSEYWQSVNPE